MEIRTTSADSYTIHEKRPIREPNSIRVTVRSRLFKSTVLKEPVLEVYTCIDEQEEVLSHEHEQENTEEEVSPSTDTQSYAAKHSASVCILDRNIHYANIPSQRKGTDFEGLEPILSDTQ